MLNPFKFKCVWLVSNCFWFRRSWEPIAGTWKHVKGLICIYQVDLQIPYSIVHIWIISRLKFSSAFLSDKCLNTCTHIYANAAYPVLKTHAGYWGSGFANNFFKFFYTLLLWVFLVCFACFLPYLIFVVTHIHIRWRVVLDFDRRRNHAGAHGAYAWMHACDRSCNKLMWAIDYILSGILS